MADKIYADGIIIKARETQIGEILKVSIKVEDFAKFVKANKKPDGWLNLDILPRKEKSQTGQTHYVTLDTWTPDSNAGGNGGGSSKPAAKAASKPAAKKETVSSADGFEEDDIPF